MNDFTFEIMLGPTDLGRDDVEAVIYAGRCSDSIVREEQGRLMVKFNRKNNKLADALVEAIEDVRSDGYEPWAVVLDDGVMYGEYGSDEGGPVA